MNLFKLTQDNRVEPAIETLLIPAFAAIWERDESVLKERAVAQMAYVEFLYSPKRTNPFAGFTEDDREREIVKRLFKEYPDYNVKGDLLVQDACVVYEELLNSSSYNLQVLKAARKGAEKLLDFFETVDLAETNERGTLLHKPRDLTGALGDLSKIFNSINEMQVKVENELYGTVKTKGQKQIGMFEDPEIE
jgi:hypothetical protein